MPAASKPAPPLNPILADPLQDVGRAHHGALAYFGVHQKLTQLANDQLLNEHSDDDPVPSPQGGIVRNPDNSPVTYAARRERLKRAAEHLREAHADIEEQFIKQLEIIRKSNYGE
jgi:hypothetical protein